MSGILYEIDPSITRSEQRSVINSVANVDGGSPVIVGLPIATDNGSFVATQPTASASNVYVAYNPTFYYVDENGILLPSRNADRRAHTNTKGKTFGVFKPVAGQIFGVIAENIDGNTAPTVGQFLETTNAKNTWTIKAAQTANASSFKVIEIRKQHFPTGTVGGTFIDLYVVETMFN